MYVSAMKNSTYSEKNQIDAIRAAITTTVRIGWRLRRLMSLKL